MVREAHHMNHNSSGGVTLSSINLLQERFRQLEKMKELRQEKELQRLLSESERYRPPTIHNHELPWKKFSGSQLKMFLPPKPHCQLSLSLWPDSNIKHGAAPPSNHTNYSWLTDAINHENSSSDIDTSLRL